MKNEWKSVYGLADHNDHFKTEYYISKQKINCNVWETSVRDIQKHKAGMFIKNTTESQTPSTLTYCGICEFYLKSTTTTHESLKSRRKKVSHQQLIQINSLDEKSSKNVSPILSSPFNIS